MEWTSRRKDEKGRSWPLHFTANAPYKNNRIPAATAVVARRQYEPLNSPFQAEDDIEAGVIPARYLQGGQNSRNVEFGTEGEVILAEGNWSHTLKELNTGTITLANALSIQPHPVPQDRLARSPVSTTPEVCRSGSMSILEALTLKPTDFYKLPEIRLSPVLGFLRWRIATIYRRLFALIFLINMVVLGIYCHIRFRNGISLQDSNTQIRAFKDIQTAVATNLMATILIRNEHFVNILYRVLINRTPTNAPLWLRRLVAKLYCMGGVHSGSAVSAAIWYLLLTIVALFNRPPSKVQAGLLSGLSVVVCAMIVIMIACAMPYVRQKIHNLFELVHRFGGWSIQGLVWVQVVAFAIVIADTNEESIGLALINLPAFWILGVIFGFTLYPWLRLRKVNVQVESLSKHAVRIWFDGYIKPIRTIRLSYSPLLEVHAFATIPEPDGKRGFSSIVSSAGDWTKRFISNPPERIWIRDISSWGLLRICTMFNRIIVVTTGSGIGPCLSLFNSEYQVPCRIVWSTRNPEQTYGKKIVEAVLKADPRALIIDTGEKGRGDMIQLSYDLYKEWEAEAVMVISNPSLTYEVVFGLESRGIPAYGPVWDS